LGKEQILHRCQGAQSRGDETEQGGEEKRKEEEVSKLESF
jgi:hypothetical protein